MINSDTISVGMAGFILNTCRSIIYSLTFTISCLERIATNFVSVKKVKEYIELDSELENGLESNNNEWPSAGSIEFCDYSALYRSDLSPALNGINLVVSGGEKLGIVGRTGAGLFTFFGKTVLL